MDWDKDVLKKVASEFGSLDEDMTRKDAQENKDDGLTKEECFDEMEMDAMMEDYLEPFTKDEKRIKQIIDEVYDGKTE